MIIRLTPHPKGAVSQKARHYVGIISAYIRPPIPPSEHAISHIQITRLTHKTKPP